MLIINHWQQTGWLTLAILSLVACFYDWRHRIIPNPVCLLIFLTALSLSPVVPTLAWGAKVTALVVGVLLLYRYQIWGGGDVKLLLAFVPAIAEKFLLLNIALIGLSGGVLCAVYLIYGACVGMQQVRGRGLPYGIPVSFACLLCVTASLKG